MESFPSWNHISSIVYCYCCFVMCGGVSMIVHCHRIAIMCNDSEWRMVQGHLKRVNMSSTFHSKRRHSPSSNTRGHQPHTIEQQFVAEPRNNNKNTKSLLSTCTAAVFRLNNLNSSIQHLSIEFLFSILSLSAYSSSLNGHNEPGRTTPSNKTCTKYILRENSLYDQLAGNESILGRNPYNSTLAPVLLFRIKIFRTKCREYLWKRSDMAFDVVV